MQTAVETLGERVNRLTISPADVPPQIRVGDEPVAEQFEAPTGPGSVLTVEGLWTTTLGRHGPLWHLHLPRETDSRPWWWVTPRPSARIARIDRPADIDSLVDVDSDDPFTIPWGELAEVVDGVWLTEEGYERLQTIIDDFGPPATGIVRQFPHSLTDTQKRRYMAFERWASGCVLWLNWCFDAVELYRHARSEALFTPPFTLLW